MLNFFKDKVKHIASFIICGIVGTSFIYIDDFPKIKAIFDSVFNQQQKSPPQPPSPTKLNDSNQITAPISASGNVTITQEIHKPISEEKKGLMSYFIV